jgi:uncharacterized delta-60 repeat protein
MVLANDNRILLGGQVPSGGDLEVAVLRGDGALDTSFAGDGHLAVDFGGTVDTFRDLTVSPVGNIVLLGRRSVTVGVPPGRPEVETLLAVITPAGVLDTQFSGDGRAAFDLNAQIDEPRAVAVEPDEQIVVAGERQLAARNVGLTFRVNSSGTIDFGYGSGGSALIDTGDPTSLTDIHVQPVVNRLVVAGTSGDTAIVARINDVGAPDTAFGAANGRIRYVPVFGASDQDVAGGVDLAVNETGGLAIGFTAGTDGVSARFATAILSPSGLLDDRYLFRGGLIHAFNGSNGFDTAAGLVLTPDSRVVLAGTVGSTAASGSKLGLLRTGGPTPAGSIAGTVFDDRNGNGVRDAGEGGADGRVVYLDLDGDDERSPGEPFATTDANGAYVIDSVPAGRYDLNLEIPVGPFVQTFPTGFVESFVEPGQALGGQNFAFREVPPELLALPGGPYTVVEGGSVQLLGAGTSSGTAITVYEWDFDYDGTTFTVDSTNQNPIFSAATLDGPSSRTLALRVRAGAAFVSDAATVNLSITNVAPTAVLTNNGPVFAGAAAAVTFSQQNDPGAADRAAGFRYSFDIGNDGTFEITDAASPSAAVPASFLAGAGTVTVKGVIKDKDNASNEYTTTLVVHPAPAPGSVTGTVFNDANRNGTRDSGEGGIANRTVYVDANGNNALDTGERSAVTNASGVYLLTGLLPGTYALRQILPGGFTQTAPSGGASASAVVVSEQTTANINFGSATVVMPANGSIGGFLWSDNDADGVLDAGEARLSGRTVYLDTNRNGVLDANERRTTTNASGNYSFGNLAAGTYRVRRVVPTGYRVSAPSSGFYDVTLAAGQNVGSRNFGATARVLISGTVFEDKNNNRVRDANEGGLSGWRVYIDSNNNGRFDSSERSTFTTSTGAWSFFDLFAGTHRVRVVQQSGFALTAPTGGAHVVALSAGATATDRLFGQRRIG